jgi:hypothetical protein
LSFAARGPNVGSSQRMEGTMMLAIESLVRLIETFLIKTSLHESGAEFCAANDNDDASEDSRRRAITR